VARTIAACRGDDRIGFVYTQMRLFEREESVTQYPDFDRQSFVLANYAHAAALMPMSALRGLRYDEDLRAGWEDWDFYLSLVERGFVGKLVDQPLLFYRRHQSRESMADALKRAEKMHRLRLQIMRKHRHLYRTMPYWTHRLRTWITIVKVRLESTLGREHVGASGDSTR
jgi:hypothetical protein